MQLTPGTKLAEYEIIALVGAGGMGKVYKARDTKLGREVAIKVLPEAFAQDKERLVRFEREARLLASLNHPNIATIHDLQESDGIRFLVMEFVPGETLAERIKRGPIPVDEALPLFKQIAEGLEAAHEKAVIHRDLKPANIKVTPEGKPKVLDFGLAKAMAGEAADQGLSESPTMTRGATEAGVLLGTAPYMSPEQARGKAVDKRTDIWAFGCCLYEALTGRTAFLGETVSDTIARIIEREPDWENLPPTTSASIQRLLQRCLQKDQNRRMRDVGEARIEIEESLSEPRDSSQVDFNKGGWKGRTVLALVVAAALLTSIAAAVAFWIFAPPPAHVQKRVTRTVVPLPPNHELYLDSISSIAISPDGEHVAYIARQGNSRQLYLRAIDELKGKAIDGTEGAIGFFFSTDSQWVGFYGGGNLMKVSTRGGAAITIAAVGGDPWGASWGPDGRIVFTLGPGSGLSQISEDGGEPKVLTIPDREQGEKTHRLPQVLPGGKAVLFTVGTGDITSFDDASIALLSLESGDYHVIVEGGTDARYIDTGHLVYARGGSLLAVPFDLDELQAMGPPIPVIQGVASSPTEGNALFSISRDGSLLYTPGDFWGDDRRVVWVDREGRSQPLIEEKRAFLSSRLSPDGRSLALTIAAANDSVWVYDLTRSTLTRLTFGFGNSYPVWTPDGRRLAFRSTRAGSGRGALFWQAADGSGQPERLTTSERPQWPCSWSPDGSILALEETNMEKGWDISVLSMDGDRTPEPFLQTDLNEAAPMFSPNGRWIAYESDESGQYQVYIRPFPSAEGKRQVSTGGGNYPVWNPNGKELFYRNGDKMMVVDVETEGELVLGTPQMLFEKPSLLEEYDVAPDGQHFVMIEEGESQPAPTQLILVQNWGEELKRLVPTN